VVTSAAAHFLVFFFFIETGFDHKMPFPGAGRLNDLTEPI